MSIEPSSRTHIGISRLSIVIPVFNSEETIRSLVDVLVAELTGSFRELEIVLVNDGSADHSDARCRDAVVRYPGLVKYVRLSRNFGEHNAAMCGLHNVSGDVVVIVDDDFQNPPSEVRRLCEKLGEGYDVVYSYYETKYHGWFRNLGSAFTDWVLTLLYGKPKDLYLSSFKAMNAFLVRQVIQYNGPYPYIDGLVLRSTDSIGQQHCIHAERIQGRSNYTLRRLLHLWLDVFTSFSILPLRIASVLGLAMSIVGLVLAIYFTISWSVGGIVHQGVIPPGWASVIVSVTLFAGLQLCVLGMIGEYLGRLYQAQSRKPQFAIRERWGFDDADE